jgi:hypothetical protein
MSEAAEIEWEDPPARSQGPGARGVWVERLAPLHAQPGRWAKLGRFHLSTPKTINKGLCYGVEAGQYEAVGRNQSGGKVDLYVRYIDGDQ